MRFQVGDRVKVAGYFGKQGNKKASFDYDSVFRPGRSGTVMKTTLRLAYVKLDGFQHSEGIGFKPGFPFYEHELELDTDDYIP